MKRICDELGLVRKSDHHSQPMKTDENDLRDERELVHRRHHDCHHGWRGMGNQGFHTETDHCLCWTAMANGGQSHVRVFATIGIFDLHLTMPQETVSCSCGPAHIAVDGWS